MTSNKAPFKRGDRVRWGTFTGTVRGLIAPSAECPNWRVVVGGAQVPAIQCSRA